MKDHAAYVFDLDGVVRDFAPSDADPAIEADLGHELAHDEVSFTDGRDENVAAAREFGWDAEVFRH